MKTVLVIDAPEAPAVKKMFTLNQWITNPKIVKPSLICFVGGEDVDPWLYGEENTSSYCNPTRDARETAIFNNYYYTPKVGICRGGQFLNVMSGGKMIQHIEGHQMTTHLIKEYENGEYQYIAREVKGDHHQAMLPQWSRTKKVIKARAKDNTPEVLWYPETKSLCFQPHPEWGHKPTEQYFFELINRYFNL